MLQRLHRDRLNLNVPVSHGEGGSPLGRLYDLSLGGFSLTGSGVPPDPTVTDIAVTLPWAVQGLRFVNVTAEQRWTQQSGGRWRVGYRIVSCPDDQLVALNKLSPRASTQVSMRA